jgi:hypothetical protein
MTRAGATLARAFPSFATSVRTPSDTAPVPDTRLVACEGRPGLIEATSTLVPNPPRRSRQRRSVEDHRATKKMASRLVGLTSGLEATPLRTSLKIEIARTDLLREWRVGSIAALESPRCHVRSIRFDIPVPPPRGRHRRARRTMVHLVPAEPAGSDGDTRRTGT